MTDSRENPGSPFLSVVIPMYQEALRVERTISSAANWLSLWHRSSELILVDDGSTDTTFDVASGAARHAPRGSLLSAEVLRHTRNQGKGAAVRTGMGAASGRWVLFMDADNSTHVSEVERLLAGVRGGAELAIGSREAASADVRKTALRGLSGGLFRGALRLMGMSLALDTQCGFKLYRADAAAHILRYSTEDRFAFDVEHLAIARRDGIGVVEVGVRWEHATGGTVSVFSDGLKMLGAVRDIRARLRATPRDPFVTTFPIEQRSDREIEIKPGATEPTWPSEATA